MKKVTLIMTVLMLMDFTAAFAWGPKGHDVVAAIAEQHLTPKSKRKINKLLDGQSIVHYASWMDNIQNSPYWQYGYNKTKTWHYANVDKGYTYETMPKNPAGDVVTGLEFLTKEMTELGCVKGWSNGSNKGLYLWRWVNPHPGKTISSIDIVSKCGSQIPLIAAISVEDNYNDHATP